MIFAERSTAIMFNDTIIAISTPMGYSGLGVVRLSGRKALWVGKKIFRPKKERKMPARRLIFGGVFDFESKEFFDAAYMAYFPAPNSYTREDMVEITCHGSPVVLEEIIRLGVRSGARLAHPGEFTLRAYLNGRIDILQAEAVNDLIRAASLQGAKLSFRQMEGGLSRRMAGIRSRIIELLGRIEAGIEFPDEGLRVSKGQISKILVALIGNIRVLIASYDTGRLLTDGVAAAIVGRANVGKSTLFNALLETDRAIVSPFPGTTRDYLKEKIKIRDTFFSLIDMAGIERAVHPVEQESIRRGKKIAVQADGLLLLFDSSRRETAEDLALLKRFRDKKAILVFNKADLARNMDERKIKRLAGRIPAIEVSALKKTNINRLKDMIFECFAPSAKGGEDMLLHLREKIALEEILGFLQAGLDLLRRGYPDEIYAEEIRKALPLIGRLTGEIKADEVIEDIFNRFCVGK
jgi:tRNA modification GTPase